MTKSKASITGTKTEQTVAISVVAKIDHSKINRGPVRDYNAIKKTPGYSSMTRSISRPSEFLHTCGLERHTIGKVKFFSRTDPKKSTVCWYCTEPFSETPVQCPRAHHEETNTYLMEGSFCSYACVLSYIKVATSLPSEQWAIAHNVSKICRANKAEPCLNASPHWSCLQKFGGHMTIEQFRASSKNNEVPRTLPATSRVVFTGYSHTLQNPSDQLDPYNKFDGLEVPAACEPSVASMPVNAREVPRRPRVSTYVPKAPAVNSARYQKETSKHIVRNTFQRKDRTTAAAVNNMHKMMGIVKPNPV